jgi:hypothetical protein
LKNEIKILRKKYKDKNPKFIVFSYEIEKPFYINIDVEYREYFPVGIKKPKNIVRNIKNFFIFL